MCAADKLQLITFLNLTQVVNSVGADEDAEFSEGMAKLVNAQGTELTRILMEVPHLPKFSDQRAVPTDVKHRFQSYPPFERAISFTFAILVRRLRRYQCCRFPVSS